MFGLEIEQRLFFDGGIELIAMGLGTKIVRKLLAYSLQLFQDSFDLLSVCRVH